MGWRCKVAFGGWLVGLWVTAAWGEDTVELLRVPQGGLQPQAAVDAEGALHLVYFAGEARAGDLYYVRRGPQEKDFSKPLRVNDQEHTVIAVGTVRGGHMALGQNGRVHVAWMSADNERPGMFYTRLDDGDTGFEPQRNVTRVQTHLDGGGALAADGQGRVYVAWHAGEGGEANRQVWVARSTDGGATFAEEQRANPGDTGACGCCGMRAGTGGDGRVYMLYRAATDLVHRDMYLLAAADGGGTFTQTLVHPWELNACPMSTASLRPVPGGVLAAWETAGQVYFARVTDTASIVPVEAPGASKKRKHPVAVGNGRGDVLLVWTEGTGWGRGGALVWQVFDKDGRPTGVAGRVEDGVPVWGSAAAVALAGGEFAVMY